MTTLSELAALYLSDLNGSTGNAWNATQIKNWIKEAIQELPLLRPTTHTLTATADGQSEYTLPVSVKAISFVWHHREQREIPLGNGGILYGETGVFFHFLDRFDQTADNELYLSDGAAALIQDTDTLAVQAHSQHTYDLGDDDDVTVPVAHLRPVRLAVELKAYEHRLSYHAGQLTMQEVDWLVKAIESRREHYQQAVLGSRATGQEFKPFVVWENPE